MKIIKLFKIESKEETIECNIDATMITHYLGIDIAYPLSQMSLVDLYNLANIRVALLASDGVPRTRKVTTAGANRSRKQSNSCI
jgi:hypothetical protein